MQHSLELNIRPQPTDSTCGHTCLQAVYGYWGDTIPLEEIITEIGQLREGGTLAVQLAIHALRRGYAATICTYNLYVFDPTWFHGSNVDLAQKLRAQYEAKHRTDERIAMATQLYLQFLELGGQLQMQPLEEQLLVRSLLAGVPILSGLSATFLYQESRERVVDGSAAPEQDGDQQGRAGDSPVASSVPDDVAGFPVGHFVVLSGYDPHTSQVLVADPMTPNPFAKQIYAAPLAQVAAAVLLGIATYDANLLMIQPKRTD